MRTRQNNRQINTYRNKANVTNATATFLGERVERLLDYLDEMVRASSFTH
jgi:hypothetical protein